VASGVISESIDLRALKRRKITFRPASRYRLACERTRSNAKPGEFASPRLCLLRLGFISADETFDAFVKAWARSPIRVELTNPSDRVKGSGLRECEASGLSRPARGPWAAGTAPAALRVLGARLPVIFGRDIRQDSVVASGGIRARPLATVGMTRRHARLVGIEMRPVPSEPMVRLDIDQSEPMQERSGIAGTGQQMVGVRR